MLQLQNIINLKLKNKVMKKKQSDNFIISYVVYPFDLLVSLGESDEVFNNTLLLLGVDLDGDIVGKIDNTSVEGRTLMLSTNQSILRMKNYPTTNKDFSNLQHEIFHVVDFLFNKIGIKLSPKSDEAYAYMIGYLTLQIYNKIKK